MATPKEVAPRQTEADRQRAEAALERDDRLRALAVTEAVKVLGDPTLTTTNPLSTLQNVTEGLYDFLTGKTDQPKDRECVDFGPTGAKCNQPAEHTDDHVMRAGSGRSEVRWANNKQEGGDQK